MNLPSTSLFAFLVLAPAVTGCAPTDAIPPTNTAVLLETPATLGEGRQSVEATVATSSGLFGPGVSAGTVAYMRGVSNHVDVGVAPTVQSFSGGSSSPRIDGFQESYGYAYGADARVKVNPFDSKHVAIFGSLGGAYNHYATFASGSAGVSIGYDNDYVVPFVDLVAYGSVPLAREAFTYRSNLMSSSSTATPRTIEPSTTYGGIVSAGLAVKATKAVSIKAAMHRAEARSETDTLGAFGAAASLDVTF